MGLIHLLCRYQYISNEVSNIGLAVSLGCMGVVRCNL